MPGEGSAELLGHVFQLRVSAAKAVRDSAFPVAAELARDAQRTGEAALADWPAGAPQRAPLVLATEATDWDYRLASGLGRLPAAESMLRVSQLSDAISHWTDAVLSIEQGSYDGALELTRRAAEELVEARDDVALALGESLRLSHDLAVILQGGVDISIRTQVLLTMLGPVDADHVTIQAALGECPHHRNSYDGTCIARPPCPPLR